jgi:hypothetical protein
MKRAKKSWTGFSSQYSKPSVASFAGSIKLVVRHPRLGFAIAWG